MQDEHGTVTCVGPLDTGSPNPNVMMSGAKDGTITVWDIRSQKPAIHMAVSDPADDSAMVRPQPSLTPLHDCRSLLCMYSYPVCIQAALHAV